MKERNQDSHIREVRSLQSRISELEDKLGAAKSLSSEFETNLDEARDRITELENELASFQARWDTSAKSGHEAEDLRREIEKLIESESLVSDKDLQDVLDEVSARDSLAWLQSRDDEDLARQVGQMTTILASKEKEIEHLSKRVGSFTAMKDEASRAWTRIAKLESQNNQLERDGTFQKKRGDSIELVLGQIAAMLRKEGRAPMDIAKSATIDSQSLFIMEEAERVVKGCSSRDG